MFGISGRSGTAVPLPAVQEGKKGLEPKKRRNTEGNLARENPRNPDCAVRENVQVEPLHVIVLFCLSYIFCPSHRLWCNGEFSRLKGNVFVVHPSHMELPLFFVQLYCAQKVGIPHQVDNLFASVTQIF